MTVTGGCRCGASRYTLAREALPPVYCCHCRDCQTWSGSAFSMQSVVPENELAGEGPIAPYSFITPSGATSTQYVCGTCHTRLWNVNTARPGLAIVRAGTFDESDRLEPILHIWVKRRQPWVTIPDGVPAFAEAASPVEFFTLLTR
ncbi:GFA family protein [Sphingomonas sp. DT-204]|uniref:GFA family protein n=1 Tax=Sphingomonas sp. DT-204 TaxID=3396166 RepID=UPI003F19D5AD